MNTTSYTTEYDSIVAVLEAYIAGCRQGKSELMRDAFHPGASFIGYAGGALREGTQFLFDWIDGNGPAQEILPRFASVEIMETIAVVRLEVEGWSGKLAGSGVQGSGVHMSDAFTLLKTEHGWKIVLKAFHWHD